MENSQSALLTENQVSSEFGIPPATLRKWRWEKSHLAYVKLGKSVRYRREDIQDFIQSGLVGVVSDGQ